METRTSYHMNLHMTMYIFIWLLLSGAGAQSLHSTDRVLDPSAGRGENAASVDIHGHTLHIFTTAHIHRPLLRPGSAAYGSSPYAPPAEHIKTRILITSLPSGRLAPRRQCGLAAPWTHVEFGAGLMAPSFEVVLGPQLVGSRADWGGSPSSPPAEE